MNNASFMEKLLEGVEVEWKALGDVIKSLKTGLNPRKNFQLNTSDAEGFYVTVREIQNGKIVFLDKTDRVNNRALKLINNRSNLESGDILFSGTGTVGRTAVIDTKPETWNIKEGVYVIKPDQKLIDSKYLSYLLNTQYIVKEYSKKIVGSPVVSLPMSELKKFPIPIPPLNIQAEIVRILDAFTALTAELTAELTARKKQYNYYRDQLLSFEDGEVKWKTLGEVATIQRGASPRPIAKYITDDETGVPWIKIGDTSPNSKFVDKTTQKITSEGAKKSRVLRKGAFILSNSMSYGRPYILNIDGAIHDGWASISDFEEKLNSDFLYHYLSSKNVQNYWESKINSSSVSNLNSDIIKTLQIPILPLSAQARIAATLDKFDALTNSITEGLPREIALRQQQYAYYRGLLLSFPKAEVETALRIGQG
jgi:type I restriction enzyme S subunit